MNTPLITIVTVCYNSADTLKDTIESVLNQTYAHIEYIIIDGKSTDHTLSVISNYQERITLLSEPDKGIYDAMNKALKLANGQWLYFLGADDVLYNDTVVETLVGMFAEPDSVYYGNAIFKNSQLLYRMIASKKTLCYRNLSHQTIFYPIAVYKQHSYSLNYPIFADHIYNIALFKAGYKFTHLEQTIAVYNDAGKSSFVFDSRYYKDLASIVTKAFGLKYGIYVHARIFAFKMKRHLLGRKNEG